MFLLPFRSPCDFLCIALSDLLPDIHFHSHDRGKLIVPLLVGISLAYVL